MSIDFVVDLHKHMFGKVWKWAGQFRKTERNIGIATYRIAQELAALISDTLYWIDNKTYPADEIAIRVHHRLVCVHPFPNDNGRHARMMADLLIEKLGGKPFSWGGGSMFNAGELRHQYISALRAADNHDIQPLVAFARR